MSPEARVRYEFSLDTAFPVRAIEGVVRLKGWCFTPHGATQPVIQLRVRDIVLSTTAHTRRDDVAAVFPQSPGAATSGFELSGHIPAGLSTATLWAGRDGFGWEQLLAFSIYAEAAVLHGAIDLPLDPLITENRSIDGWCFHPQREIAEVWLHYGTRQVRCRHYGHERTDVAAQFPHLPQARLCGFSSDDVLQPGEGKVRIRAVDRDGGVYFCETDRVIQLRPAATLAPDSDPRLDGRALYRACSSRQHELPPLRIALLGASPAHASAAAAALATLPGDRWQIVAQGAAIPPKPWPVHVSFQESLSVDHAAWTLVLQEDDLPDIHGVMAAWIAAADHPSLAGLYGDLTLAVDSQLQIQPAWSATLALAGGIDATTPTLLAPGTAISATPLWALAQARADVVHINASLARRQSPARASQKISANPAAPAQRLTISAIALASAADLDALKKTLSGEVDEWIDVAPDASPATIAASISRATRDALLFVTPGAQPVSAGVIAKLAAHLAKNPRAAVVPLLLGETSAPWRPEDCFAPRVRATLAGFDAAYPHWASPGLALWDRDLAYFPLTGLLIGRERLAALGGFDTGLDSVAASGLDLAFRLRAARTPAFCAASVRWSAPVQPPAISSFDETWLLDRWDQDDANPLFIRPLVPVEVLA